MTNDCSDEDVLPTFINRAYLRCHRLPLPGDVFMMPSSALRNSFEPDFPPPRIDTARAKQPITMI